MSVHQYPAGTAGHNSPSTDPGQNRRQYEYHRWLFPALHEWEETERRIVDFTEDSGPDGLLGLDQMGHFGPHGCDLVVERIRAAYPAAGLALAELGSGFGGALRYLVDRLAVGPGPVHRAYGVELVPEHCAVSRRISQRQGRSSVTEICASADRVPLPDGVLDVAVITGSMPHFPDPGRVLREAHRLLRPGGLLVCTEEVSIVAAGVQPSAAFREVHPAGVFFVTSLPDRLAQVRAAGFVDVRTEDLRDWAVALLSDRVKALRLFRGTVVGILGAASADLVERTLDTAGAEYSAGRLVPMLLSAVRQPDA